jgi:hypothetical protein
VTNFRDDAKISERSFGVDFFNFFLSSLASSASDFATASWPFFNRKLYTDSSNSGDALMIQYRLTVLRCERKMV